MSETYDPAQRRIHELEQEQCEMRQALAKVEELTKELERSQRGFEVAKKASLHWEEEAKVYQQRAKHAEQGAAIAYDVRHAAQERADTSSRQVAEMGKVQEEMRRALAVAHAGAGLYADDGELQDSTRDPFIDWKRDPWNVIKDKLELRAVQVLEEGGAGAMMRNHSTHSALKAGSLGDLARRSPRSKLTQEHLDNPKDMLATPERVADPYITADEMHAVVPGNKAIRQAMLRLRLMRLVQKGKTRYILDPHASQRMNP